MFFFFFSFLSFFLRCLDLIILFVFYLKLIYFGLVLLFISKGKLQTSNFKNLLICSSSTRYCQKEIHNYESNEKGWYHAVDETKSMWHEVIIKSLKITSVGIMVLSFDAASEYWLIHHDHWYWWNSAKRSFFLSLYF